jgi:hypothetical protein
VDNTVAVGAEITRTSARTLYFDVTTAEAATGTPQVAILGVRSQPDATTVWKDAAWVGPDVVTLEGTPDETHTRRMGVLVAGPQGPTIGAPLVLPAKGEYSTWVGVSTGTDRVEVQGSLLSCS